MARLLLSAGRVCSRDRTTNAMYIRVACGAKRHQVRLRIIARLYAIPYGEPPNSTLRRNFDTSSRLGATLAAAGVRTTREPAAGVDSLVECGSRCLLSYLLDKRLPLFTGQELKEPGDRV